MSEYTSERVQLNQLLNIINSQEEHKRNVIFTYCFEDDYFFISARSLDGFITYNLVTQKNEQRKFKTIKSAAKALGITGDLTCFVAKLIFV